MAQGQKTGGRQAGTPNKITAQFKDAVRIVYEDIGGHQAFAAWARANPTAFYQLAGRLIPTELAVSGDRGVTVIVQRGVGQVIDNEVVSALPHIEH